MLANLMLASKPSISQCLVFSAFCSTLVAHLLPAPCFEVYSAFQEFIPNKTDSLQFLSWQGSHGALWEHGEN